MNYLSTSIAYHVLFPPLIFYLSHQLNAMIVNVKRVLQIQKTKPLDLLACLGDYHRETVQFDQRNSPVREFVRFD
jgi:hypothetical protein